MSCHLPAQLPLATDAGMRPTAERAATTLHEQGVFHIASLGCGHTCRALLGLRAPDNPLCCARCCHFQENYLCSDVTHWIVTHATLQGNSYLNLSCLC